MIRNSIVSASRQVGRSSRLFSISARRMAEGDAGAPRSGGAVQGDAWTKREQASEDYYVKQEEMKKLQQLRQKLKDQAKNIEDLQSDIDNMIEKGEKQSK